MESVWSTGDIGKDALLKNSSRRKISRQENVELSFSGMVKEELSRQISSARHCRIAETAALLVPAAELHLMEA